MDALLAVESIVALDQQTVTAVGTNAPSCWPTWRRLSPDIREPRNTVFSQVEALVEATISGGRLQGHTDPGQGRPSMATSFCPLAAS